MLDDIKTIMQRDSYGALDVAMRQYEQATVRLDAQLDLLQVPPRSIVIAGMGGSALAARLLVSWLGDKLSVPILVVQDYCLPGFVDSSTLVITSSYSGNTEETIACYEEAARCGAVCMVITSGGVLLDRAKKNNYNYVLLPEGYQPRATVIMNLRALLMIIESAGLLESSQRAELEDSSEWLRQISASWAPNNTKATNKAKQLAEHAAGKTAVFYGGELTGPVAYKWKISWNENAKNIAFMNQLPEMNHNEFIGWTSHPVEKQFSVFDIISSFEHERVQKRFLLTDKLLSGKRPKAVQIKLEGDTVIKQLLYGCVLADFTSIYLAIINGVNPTPVELIETLKQQLN